MAEFDAQPITMPGDHHYVRILQADGEEFDIVIVPSLDRDVMTAALAEHGYDDVNWLPEG